MKISNCNTPVNEEVNFAPGKDSKSMWKWEVYKDGSFYINSGVYEGILHVGQYDETINNRS